MNGLSPILRVKGIHILALILASLAVPKEKTSVAYIMVTEFLQLPHLWKWSLQVSTEGRALVGQPEEACTVDVHAATICG